MESVRKDIAETRAQTDASLGAERADTDSVRLLAAARARRALDDLIERDRLAADERLKTLREGADRVRVNERTGSPAVAGSLALERQAVDASKKAERDLVDAQFKRERLRADAVVERERQDREADRERQESRRQETDDQLSLERNRADAAVSALDETQHALADAQSEQDRRLDVLGMVTHDLRNPLSVIVLNAQVIAEETADPSIREDALEVTRAASRMERLLMDLLDVARIESKTLCIAHAQYDVGEFVTEVLRSYQPLFAARGVKFDVEIPVPSLIASFDHDRVVQVLSNLLGNAMKFTPAQGSVDLHVARRGQEVEFVVHDSGRGIDATSLPHVFERFWQIDHESRRGLGLGLYICRQIVEAHGGRIGAESQVGKGATFRFTLPLDPESNSPLFARPPSEPKNDDGGRGVQARC